MDDHGSAGLFDESPRFEGLPETGFEVFSIADRQTRRRAIIDAFHPALEALGEDLADRLAAEAEGPLHVHLPRLDWPPDYEPFCTWLALSKDSHGYQAGPQLNVGVHADHVAVRLGWDATADAFGRFEFLCRHAGLGSALREVASAANLAFRVYVAEPWPDGSKCIFQSPADLLGSLDELRRHGVWWELGRRFDLPEAMSLVSSTAFTAEALRILGALLPLYLRI